MGQRKTTPKNPRCTKAEMQLRVEEVMTWVLSGAPKYSMTRKASDKWGIGERAFERILQLAAQEIKEASTTTKEEAFSKAVMRYEEVLYRAKKENNLRLLLDTQSRLDKLYGLDNVNLNLVSDKPLPVRLEFVKKSDEDSIT